MTEALSIAALLVALVSAAFAFRSTRAAERSARMAEGTDRRARTPQLKFFLDRPAPAPAERAIYRIRNDGPQDLDSVVLHKPVTNDGITYPIAWTGKTQGWADEVDVGPLRLGTEERITLCCGAADQFPEFQVRVECRSRGDSWDLLEPLPSPRPPPS